MKLEIGNEQACTVFCNAHWDKEGATNSNI